MQRTRLRRDLTRRGHDSQVAYLFGVVRLVLEQLTLQLMYLNLTTGVVHAPKNGERERDHHDN
jgi:hypothetical protein